MTAETRHVSTTEKLFRIAILLKGLDGVAQLVCGVLLIFLRPAAITALVHFVVVRDLLGRPTGTLATDAEHAASALTAGGTRWFVIFFLLLHGVIKVGLVLALLRKVMPAYPVAAVALGAFVVYELIRAVRTHSLALPIFAAGDVVIIILIVREYLLLRRERAGTRRQPSKAG